MLMNAVVCEVTYKPLTKQVFDAIRKMGISEDQISIILDGATTESGLLTLISDAQGKEIDYSNSPITELMVEVKNHQPEPIYGWLVQEVQSEATIKSTKKKSAEFKITRYRLKFGETEYSFFDATQDNRDLNPDLFRVITSEISLFDLAGKSHEFEISDEDVPFDFEIQHTASSNATSDECANLSSLAITCSNKKDLAAVTDWLTDCWEDEITSTLVEDLTIKITSDDESIDSIQDNAPYILYQDTKEQLPLTFVRSK